MVTIIDNTTLPTSIVFYNKLILLGNILYFIDKTIGITHTCFPIGYLVKSNLYYLHRVNKRTTITYAINQFATEFNFKPVLYYLEKDIEKRKEIDKHIAFIHKMNNINNKKEKLC